MCSGVRNGGNEGASCTELFKVGNARGKLGLEILYCRGCSYMYYILRRVLGRPVSRGR